MSKMDSVTQIGHDSLLFRTFLSGRNLPTDNNLEWKV